MAGLAARFYLHDPVAQQLVLSGKQILHEIVPAFVSIARGAGEMMIDSHARQPAEIFATDTISPVLPDERVEHKKRLAGMNRAPS